MKNNRIRAIARSREWDPIPECELLSLSRPFLPVANHKPATRKVNLRCAIADRRAIEQAENEGMIVRAG